MPFARIVGLGVWLGFLLVVSSGAILVAGSRIGESKASSYGTTWDEFTASWGGEIVVEPPTFALIWEETVLETDAVLKQRVGVVRSMRLPVPVTEINLRAQLAQSHREYGSLSFNAFESRHVDVYRVTNDTSQEGGLWVTVGWPAGASILTDYAVVVDGQPVPNPQLGEEFGILSRLAPGATAEVSLTWATKGADQFTYRLSSFSKRVLPRARARLEVDTDRFALLRFGLNHTRTNENGGSVVEFDLPNFSTTQDIGLRFVSQRSDLEFAGRVVNQAPAAVMAFLASLLVWSQVQRVRFLAFHYLSMTVTIVSYFIFLSYLVRWLGTPASIAVAGCISAVLGAALAPPIFGRSFALRVVAPSLLAFTVGFSLLFLLPTLRGIAVLSFLFLAFAGMLIAAVRSNVANWPLVRGWEGEG